MYGREIVRLREALEQALLGSLSSDSIGNTIAQAALSYRCRAISSDYVCLMGDKEDGVIEFIARPAAGGGFFETGYYYGARKPKPIINISPMIGCPASCTFCELGRLPFQKCLSAEEMLEQVVMMLRFASSVTDIDRQHKVNIAKSGEPLLNPHLADALELIGAFGFSFKLSTVLPRGRRAKEQLAAAAEFASGYLEPVQLQISLISTAEEYRLRAGGSALAPFREVRQAIDLWCSRNPPPKGRKPNLSLILSAETPADPQEISGIFPPELVNFRFRSYVPTENGKTSGMEIIGPQHLAEIQRAFAGEGYQVSDWATPTPTEWRFRLSSNSTLARYLAQVEE